VRPSAEGGWSFFAQMKKRNLTELLSCEGIGQTTCTDASGD